jgi:hypothetical protein
MFAGDDGMEEAAAKKWLQRLRRRLWAPLFSSRWDEGLRAVLFKTRYSVVQSGSVGLRLRGSLSSRSFLGSSVLTVAVGEGVNISTCILVDVMPLLDIDNTVLLTLICDEECEHVVLLLIEGTNKCELTPPVALPDVPTVKVKNVLFPLVNTPTMDVGSGSKLNAGGSTSDVVPDGQIAIPLMMHGLVGCGQMIVGAVAVDTLKSGCSGGGVKESGGGGMANPEVVSGMYERNGDVDVEIWVTVTMTVLRGLLVLEEESAVLVSAPCSS